MSIGDPKFESAKHVMHEAVDVNQGRLTSCDFDCLLTMQISLIFGVLPYQQPWRKSIYCADDVTSKRLHLIQSASHLLSPSRPILSRNFDDLFSSS